jgi:hypothetical protein
MLKQRAQITKPKLEQPQRAPPAHMQAPWTNATPPGRLHAKHHLKTGQLQQFSPNRSDRSTPLVRLVCNMWTGPALWPVKPVTSTGQTGAHQSPEMARNHLKTFWMHPASHFKLKLLPLVDNAWIKLKMQNFQPRVSQIDKIQHRMLHMSKWAS